MPVISGLQLQSSTLRGPEREKPESLAAPPRQNHRSFAALLAQKKLELARSSVSGEVVTNDSILMQKFPSATAYLQNFAAHWEESSAKITQLMHGLPRDVRPLFEMQVLVNKLGLETQMLTKAGETFVGTLRRMQQMGS